MINKIQIKNIGTYEDLVGINPTEINYFYGSNGSGKTTLSKLIKNPISYPNCELGWTSTPFQTIVYNSDFVKENFLQSSSIKGIFTLGKDTKEAREFIDNAKAEIEKLNPEIEGNKKILDRKKSEKIAEKEKIQNKCWRIKQKYDDIFKEAFKGSIGSKERFLSKCLSESSNDSDLLSEEQLKEECNKIFSNSLIAHRELENITYDKLNELESNPILLLKIIGKEDVQIGKLIKSLNNSDWVRQGIKFLNNSEDICPFCQQRIEHDLKFKIEDFFDETYSQKCKDLEDFKGEYSLYISDLISKLHEIETFNISIIDINKLNEKLDLIDSKFRSNLIKIDEKIKSPSISIELESIIEDLEGVSLILSDYISKITENNNLVKNISKEKVRLCNRIWRYIYSELEIDINNYSKAIEGISKAQESLIKSKSTREEKVRELKIKIGEKESEVTSVVHTVNEINRILELFGFKNFKLSESEQKGFYKIVRPNGEDAQQTLSEGEYTFITFLYFYQLIKGSTEKTGIVSDRIIVIDDPISSLDSNVLFIVSNLVKEILKDCKEKRNGINQVFLLTHNVYFHKEITFKGSRESNTKEESFWIVRKLNGKSTINKYEDNPIQTTYELLWSEIDDLDKINTATIFNTLRRILEYYFNILGGMKYEECINKFEGEDKLVCRSLISWINDGSHFIGDDFEMPMDTDKIEKYLDVFKLIFEKMGHEGHFNMMMNRRSRVS